jgi:hypothetical protein
MSFGLYQILECTICGQSCEDHAPNCPELACKAVAALKENIRCPQCRGSIGLNTEDYYECRKCHSLFSTSEIVVGYDVATLKKVILLDWKRDVTINCVLLPIKGKGDMFWEKQVKIVNDARNEARKLAKRLRKNQLE